MTAWLVLRERKFSAETMHFESALGKHDLMTITTDDADDATKLTNLPASLAAEEDRTSVTVELMVDTVVPNGYHGESGDGQIHCLGASAVMRSGKPRVWQDKRPFDIMRSIVSAYGFGIEMETVPGTIPFLAQSSETDWQMANYVASECGLVLYRRGTVLRAVSIRREIRRASARQLPLLDLRTDKDGRPIGNVLEHIAVSTATPIGFERHEFVGVDDKGNTFKVVANDDAPLSKGNTERVATLADALAAKERVEQRRYTQSRCAVLIAGTYNLRTGDCVLLNENGRSRNVWFITEVTISLDHDDKLSTVLSLCRAEGDAPAPLPLPYFGVEPEAVSTGTAWRSNKQWEFEL